MNGASRSASFLKQLLIYQVAIVLLVAGNLGLTILFARAQYRTAAQIDRLATEVAQLQYQSTVLQQRTDMLREVIRAQNQARQVNLQDLMNQQIPGTPPLTEEDKKRMQEQRSFWEWLLSPDPSEPPK